MGHSRRSDGQQGFAECPLCLQWRPTLCVATNRRDVPRAEVGDLFDYLVGQQLERVRHGEAEGGGGLEINDQFVFERELNGQIARI